VRINKKQQLQCHAAVCVFGLLEVTTDNIL